MKILRFALPVFTSIALAACGDNAKEQAAAPARSSFFDKAGVDTTVRPQDDFFQYANGLWMKNTAIPKDQSGWGSYYTLYDENRKQIRAMLEQAAAAGGASGSMEQKLGDYYSSGMDSVAIDKLGAAPLKPMLSKIDAVKDYKELMTIVADIIAAGGNDGLISMQVGADEKNSSMNILNLYQSGLSLPEKDYYTKQDSSSKAARNALVKFATRLFTLTGTTAEAAEKDAAALLALETRLASFSRTPAEQRNPQKNYNKMSVADLEKQSPNINWQGIFTKMNVKTDSINAGQPEYYTGLSQLLALQPVEVWKAKLKFEYIKGNAALLSRDFVNASFDFNKNFSGQEQDDPRWKKIVNRVEAGLGEMVGQLYVKKYFTEEAKRRMDALINNLQKAFEKRINQSDWMSDSTRKRALVKLNTFLKKIGYPSKWKNFDDVTISKSDFFANAQNIRLHHQKETTAKIGKPVDRTEWMMNPQDVNAYYNPTNNEIVFPAGILQFPFFDVNADDAINYGAIGMVIGHEMTHGFDDQGSQYDEKGNMQNWWSKEDGEKFKAKTGVVVKQYNGFTILDSLHVNGELTLGENIADIGGLAIAYDAFKMTQQAQGNEKIDGFTPDQRFFLGYAQVWRLKTKDEAMRVRISTDPHSPEMYRVNGPAMNFDPFYKAFDVKEGDKMYLKPADRARIW